MNIESYILNIAAAQRTLNDLLMGVHQHKLKYTLTVNEAKCTNNDDRTVIGITIHKSEVVYTSNGIP